MKSPTRKLRTPVVSAFRNSLGGIAFVLLFGALLLGACSGSGDDGAARGGAPSTGGSAGAGGTSLGGSSAGGASAVGGAPASGGTSSSGGSSFGGASGAGSGGAAPLAGENGAAGITGARGGQGGLGGASGSGGVAAAGGGGKGGSSGTGGTTHTGAWRLMHFGDSITETTCQSILTWKKLRDSQRTNFDLVGSMQNQQSCNVSNPDRDCEGHGGYLVTDLVSNGKYASQLPQWLSADKAEIVLMHFGTNDVWNNVAPSSILNAYTTVLAALRQVNPQVSVFIAQIIPLNPNGCGDCPTRVTTLNAQIPGWATAQSSAASPVHVVDQWTGFNTSSDTGDGVHPNLTGAQKMADKWAAALIAKNLP